MTFDKFLYLIDKKALYFARADQFHDPLEGTFPNGAVKLFSALKMKNLNEFLSKAAFLCQSVAANCWHMNDSESLGMWQRYTNNGQGVVVRSTYSRLKKSMSAYSIDPIRIIEMQYITFSNAVLPPILGYPFEYKDVHYKDERELRCIIYRKNSINGKGIPVPINTETLIGDIYTSPFAPIDLHDSVRAIVAKHGLSKRIFVSCFADKGA